MTAHFAYVVQTEHARTNAKKEVAGFAEFNEAAQYAQRKATELRESHFVHVWDQARNLCVSTIYPNPSAREARVTHYVCTVTREGETYTRTGRFTQLQASEIGAMLHPDGLNMADALQLCERWKTNIYSYRVK